MKHQTKTTTTTTKPPKPAIIAVRKTCDATGTGLSHFVLMDKEVQR
ncbi:MAG: modified peptide precursor CbpA [Alphaproteobacteria bacterium]|nr:modified peptide precursor CbpA [Alphaproteobacteria bacterium]